MQDPKEPNRAQLRTEHSNGILAQKAAGLSPSLDVVWLVQDELKDLGFYDGKQDGVYGEKTTSGVKEFQKAVGLEATGVSDQKTLAALESVEGTVLYQRTSGAISVLLYADFRHSVDLSKIPGLRPDATVVFGQNGDIMNPYKADAIQRGLKDLGFYNGKQDRLYGDETMAAVQQFQKAVGLPPTGMMDKKTLSVLIPLREAALNDRYLPGLNPDTMHLKEAEAALGHKLDLSKIPALKPSGQGLSPAHKNNGAFLP